MTIEKSPASSSAQPVPARTEGHGAKSRASASDASNDAGATGFGAILGALGDALADAPAATSAQAPAAAPVQTDPGQTDTAAALVPAFDASTLLQQNPQIALQASLRAQSRPGMPDKDGVAGATAALDAGAMSQAATLNPAGLALPQESAGANPARKASVAGAPKGTDAAAGTALSVADAAVPIPESFTHALQHAGAHAKAGKELAQAGTDATQAGSRADNAAGNAATGKGAELQDSRLLAALEQARTPVADRPLEVVPLPQAGKPEKTLSERQAAPGKAGEPVYAGGLPGISAPETAASAAPVLAPGAEMQVAEQVTYWVSQNVQNAELKLDGLGASPVEVSIHLQGMEAQISFRSDEAATRSVLENAGSHLKDMLQREGLVLTGVSVGTSGSGDAGAGNERRARQAARQGLIAPLQIASVEPARSRPVGAGRSVDLFV